MSKVAIKGAVSGTATFTIESPATNTDRVLVLPNSAGTIVSKSGSFIAPADLGSGTADNTTFLRGDSTFQTINTTPTTNQVLTATAGASTGSVGTYAYAGSAGAAPETNVAPGDTLAGSSLQYRSSGDNFNGQNYTGTLSGTWRCMGFYRNVNTSFSAPLFSLWLRIS